MFYGVYSESKSFEFNIMMSKFLEYTSQKSHVLPIPRLHSTVLPTYAPQILLQKQVSLNKIIHRNGQWKNNIAIEEDK